MVELQGNVVPLLSLPVEQHPIAGAGPELQGDDVLDELDFLTPEAVGDDTLAIKIDDIRPCLHRDNNYKRHQQLNYYKSINHGVCNSFL